MLKYKTEIIMANNEGNSIKLSGIYHEKFIKI